jgi:hypothetical protein
MKSAIPLTGGQLKRGSEKEPLNILLNNELNRSIRGFHLPPFVDTFSLRVDRRAENRLRIVGDPV